jgi:FkbM family methyltransferase
MPRVYFQIGTNNGNDEFRKKVLESNPDIVVLVEPNASLVDSIKKNYSGVKGVHIYTNAIFYESGKQVELVIPAKMGMYGSRAENGITYSDVHYSLVPMNDWGNHDNMVKLKAETITFDNICEQNGISEIEYLQIDTEGFDSEIIQMIDLTKYKIKKIVFEKWNFSSECFTKHQKDKSDVLGENGMKLAIEKLQKNGYEIKDLGCDYIASRG